MNKNNITVIINDPNRFFVEGLRHCVYEHFSTRGIHTKFTPCIFNSQAKLAFLAAERLSVTNAQTLHHRLVTRSLGVFIMQDSPLEHTGPAARNPILNNFSALYRNQAVEDILTKVYDQLGRQSDSRSTYIPPRTMRTYDNLTKREAEILRYLARGMSNSAVARFLHISEKTVSAHKRNIMSKLNMSRSTELNYWLIEEGWCDSWRIR